MLFTEFYMFVSMYLKLNTGTEQLNAYDNMHIYEYTKYITEK